MTFSNRQWSDLKNEVLENEEFKSQQWYTSLTDYEKDYIEDLKQIQLQIGENEPIKQ